LAHGACFGGGNGLLAACDISLAEKNTVFAFSEVKLGIAPSTIAPFVIRRVGEFGAKELMMTGKRFKAEEAKKWNLVNHALPENELEEELENLKKQVLSSAPGAVRATKELISHVIREHHDMAETSYYTTRLISELRASVEGQEGMSAFLEKRKPNWTIE
jgi:methylglutaconyl-CoA hydratase